MSVFPSSDIAIVGIACRFAGANTPDQFWGNLKSGMSSISEIPHDRWDHAAFYAQDGATKHRSVSKWCGAIDDIKSFDHRFFRISPKEARNMDPQQRLLLEETWHCIEDSAIPPGRLQEAMTAVFVGAMTSDFERTLSHSAEDHNRYSILGNDHSILANRISHQFDLHGESVSINASSASSLVAIHKAYSALNNGECDFAFAAGVSLNTDPFKYLVFSEAGMLSPDGSCKSFSDKANGYVPGDGVAVMLLQPLDAAVKTNANIYGIVKGSAVNHSGSGRPLTVPSADAQEKVIRKALNNAGKKTSDISYLESHGSGTPVGDPVEIESIKRVFGDSSSPLTIGTVKPNIGHLEAAAGIAGVVKVLMMMKHQQIPANLNCDLVNPAIDLTETEIQLAESYTDWQPGRKLCAGVSAFGFGGVSCHLILEQPPGTVSKINKVKRSEILLLSAKTPGALGRLKSDIEESARTGAFDEMEIRDICGSLSSRPDFKYRFAMKVEDCEGLKHLSDLGLTEFKTGETDWQMIFENAEPVFDKPLFELISKNHDALVERVKNPAEPGREFKAPALRSVLKALAVSNAFGQLGLVPDLIGGRGDGVWPALIASGIVSLEDFAEVVSGRRNERELVLSGPAIPFSDHVNNHIVFPELMNASFLSGLFADIYAKQHKSAAIARRAAAILRDNSELKKESPWSSLNSGYSIDIVDLVEKSGSGLINDRTKFCFSVVVAADIVSSANARWKFKGHQIESFEALALLIKLLDSEIISRSDFADICNSREFDFQNWALHTNKKHWRELRELLPFARQSNRKLSVSKFDNWLVEARRPKEPRDTQSHLHTLHIGRSLAGINNAFDFCVSNSKEFVDYLVSSWQGGRDISWQEIYQSGTYCKVSLPTYRFKKTPHWPESKKDSSSSTKLFPPLPIITDADEKESKLNKVDMPPHNTDLKKRIKAIIASTLDLNPNLLEGSNGFEDYGYDSVGFADLCTNLNLEFGSDLTPAEFYQFKTIDSLIGHLSGVLPSAAVEKAPVSNDISYSPSKSDNAGSEPIDREKRSKSEDIRDVAIVGYAGILPNSKDLDEFWSNLVAGTDCISEIPEDRWDWRDTYSTNPADPNKSPSKWGGFIPGIDLFDAAYFGISAHEAKLMDPQQRLLLQTVWKALEHAGHRPSSYSGTNTGVFIGASTSDYDELVREVESEAHASTGINRSIIANRVSYLLDLHGPSEVIDTACSSSLVALNRGFEAVRSGRCNTAITGGVNALITPTHYKSYGKAGMLSPSGQCKTYDKDANGYVRGEGVGVVVLKSLSSALKDRDQIYAVVKASGTNHGGRAKSLTAPNPNSQAQLIQDVYRSGGIAPASIDYIENHGTGTPLGDPIEIDGLKKAFDELSTSFPKVDGDRKCYLASVKSNIGHLEAAAGVAGLLKVLVALEHSLLPASRNVSEINPYIKIDDSPFEVLIENQPWESQAGRARRAGVSSFGFGGVNAHVVVEEYLGDTTRDLKNAPDVVVLSAKTASALKAYAGQLLDCLTQTGDEVSFADLAFTLQVGRDSEKHRVAIYGSSIKDLMSSLRSFLAGEIDPCTFAANSKDSNESNLAKLLANQDFAARLVDLLIVENRYAELAGLWVEGINVNWEKLKTKGNAARRISLPTYPFEGKSFWVKPENNPAPAHKTGVNKIKDESAPFSFTLDSKSFIAQDHKFRGKAISPGVFCVDLMRKALNENEIKGDFIFSDISWESAVEFTKSDTEYSVRLDEGTKSNRARIYAISKNGVELAHTRLKYRVGELDLSMSGLTLPEESDASSVYASLSEIGFEYGPAFQVIKNIYSNSDKYVTRVKLPSHLEASFDDYFIHPAVLDGALQSCLTYLLEHGHHRTSLPMMAEAMRLPRKLPREILVSIKPKEQFDANAAFFGFDIGLFDTSGARVGSIDNITFRAIDAVSEVSVRPKPRSSAKIAATSNIDAHDAPVPAAPNANGIDGPAQNVLPNRKNSQDQQIETGNMNSELLLEQTIGYFRSIVAKAVSSEDSEIDVTQPFTEYGVDSFLTLSIIRGLEEDFGDLRKTLLFETSNVAELAKLFVQEHKDRLNELLEVVPVATRKESRSEKDVEVPGISEPPTPVRESGNPLILPEYELGNHPGLRERLSAIFDSYGGESIALSRKDIAPLIFFGTGRQAYFYFNTAPGLLLAFRYVGPSELFAENLLELTSYAEAEGLAVNVLTEINLPEMREIDYTANSFGVVQRIPDLASFKISGGKMRRLRYQINKFEQAGLAETREYKPGSDSNLDDAVFDMIERWAGTKSGVNPYIWRVKDEMETGCLGPDYRVFLTFLDNTLQNVVIISRIASDDSYLLDTEFYSTEMAAGGLDFALWNIVRTLQEEGVSQFSLGLTFGSEFISSEHGDPAVVSALRKLSEDKIFNEAGNFQFKNKFRSVNSPLYLYRPLGQQASNVADLIMMIGNPQKTAGKVTEKVVELAEDTINTTSETDSLQIEPNADQLEASSDLTQARAHAEIAVVGIGGRYPDAATIPKFWSNLKDGINSIKMGPDWSFRFVDPNARQHWGGFIEDVDKFDSLFFSISPREAENMDPQERLMLEIAWEALEDAGYYPESLIKTIDHNDIGVFVGAVWSYYEMLGAENRLRGGESVANSQHWGISNRISSYMNFSGPCLTVDTACSSSLMAIHLACESILRGECRAAIAGGINLDLHPGKHHITEAAQFLSEDGHCRTFGQGGSGYVAGEGAGALLLKPLEAAISDGDSIYGVIKSSVTNHGGRTSGYTVPNPNAQAELISQGIKKAGVTADTITCIEAHGTGTELGDPVEIQGATKAFRNDTQKNQFCSIGSVKTNIGHLEAAAGIAGATKLLLQIKNRQLVPSLHSKELNEHIDFASSPFKVQQELEHWAAVDGSDTPLRAGLSSFGAGGTNVHIIFEEYRANRGEDSIAESEELVVLSAKKDENLQNAAARLIGFLGNSTDSDKVILSDIAFTLQVGRQPMQKRVAFLVRDKQELVGLLSNYVNATGPSENAGKRIFEADKSSDSIAILLGADNREIRDLIIKKGDLAKIAMLWVNGEEIDWDSIHRDKQRRRVSLPTYSFSKVSHWIEPAPAVTAARKSGQTIHPLLDANCSTLDQIEFKKRFDLNQFIFRDHIVDGVPTLPGVGYLEMALAAAAAVMPGEEVSLQNVIWASPINSEGSDDIRVRLNKNKGLVTFGICTFENDGSKNIHSQGKAKFTNAASEPVLKKDIDAILERCTGFVDKEASYQLLATRKLTYGAKLQAISGFHYGDKEGLTRLQLPYQESDAMTDFIAHPALMDGAVQSIIGLLEHANAFTQPGVPYVPFVLTELTVFRPLTRTCFAHLTLDENEHKRNDIKKINIDILDESGNVLVRMKDFSFKAISEQVASNSASNAKQQLAVDPDKTVCYKPVWEERQLHSAGSSTIPPGETIVLFDSGGSARSELESLIGTGVSVVLVEPGTHFAKSSEVHFEIDPQSEADYARLVEELTGAGLIPNRLIHYWSKSRMLDPIGVRNSLDVGLNSVFLLSKSLLKARKSIDSKRIDLLYLFESSKAEAMPVYSAVNGFVRSLKQEGANLLCKTIEIAKTEFAGDRDRKWNAILGEFNDFDNCEIAFRDGVRFERSLQTLEVFENSNPTNVQSAKDGGIYLITGGMGGLGLIFANELVGNADVKVILSGRTVINDDIRATLDSLNTNGSSAEYISCDFTKQDSVNALINEVKGKFGGLSGVIHGAGVIRDSFLWNKTKQHFDEVIEPKVLGTLYLDEATRDIDLDYFVMFSSIASVIGNMGQSDYSSANRFMDDFASYRSALCVQGKRSGKSLSINWPLWNDGGMQVSDVAEQWLMDNWGMQPLDTEVGISAFHAGLNLAEPTFGLVQGIPEKIKHALAIGPRVESSEAVDTKPAASVSEAVKTADKQTAEKVTVAGSFSAALKTDLTRMVVELLKVDSSDIEFDANMSMYGFDSVTFTEFGNLINKDLELDITPLIFFEQETLQELSDYLLAEFGDDLNAFYSEEAAVGAVVEIPVLPQTASASENFAIPESDRPAIEDEITPDVSQSTSVRSKTERQNEPIAIIGMSGIMPQSKDLNVFWENLKEGKNLISEIPQDRWDWRKFYGESDLGNSKTEIKWGGFIPEVDKFDAEFFNISPLEAELTDPQQRLFLETVWQTVEDSGYRASELSGSNTGVFVGIGTSDYHELLREQKSDFEAYSVMGWMHAVLANRISYFFNWSGPSEPIGTACSSSLVAIDRAVQAIRNGNCDLCVAGGISLIINPGLHIGLGKAGMLAPDGKCKTFDHRADGYVRSEGVGAILLKPLSKAKADGDNIYAVIKGSAVNHGGHVNTFTTPNPKAQTAVLVKAFEDAEVDPATITNIEAHGTGTALGDPIEVQGLLNAFKKAANKTTPMPHAEGYCTLGSVKTNVGHLELAAGMAGIFKLVLSLKNKTIPASINFEKVNPYIKLEGTPFRLSDEMRPWIPLEDAEGKKIPRRAGISSFGFGGVNAHIVLEEFENTQVFGTNLDNGKQHIVPISSKYEKGLSAFARRLIGFIETHTVQNTLPPFELFVSGLQHGRDPMPFKAAFVANGYSSLKNQLDHFVDGRNCDGLFVQSNNTGTTTQAADVNLDQLISQNNLDAIAMRWVEGQKMDWEGISPRTEKISLPTYPFRRNRYWLLDPALRGAIEGESRAVGSTLSDPGIKAELTASENGRHEFRVTIDRSSIYLRDHVIAGNGMLPAAGYLEIVASAFSSIAGTKVTGFSGVSLRKPLTLTASEEGIKLLIEESGSEHSFTFISESGEGETDSFCTGSLRTIDASGTEANFDVSVFERLPVNDSIYETFRNLGYDYGKSLAVINRIAIGEREVFSSLALPAEFETQIDRDQFQTALIDGGLQCMLAAPAGVAAEGNIEVPISIEDIKWIKPLTANGFVHLTESDPNKDADDGAASPKRFDIGIYDDSGAMSVQMRRVELRTISAGKKSSIPVVAGLDPSLLFDQTAKFLAELVAKETRRDSSEISLDGSFESYGIDSFLALRMIKQLEKAIGPVSKTAFFEYSSLRSLTAFLVAQYQDQFATYFGVENAENTVEESRDESALIKATVSFLSQLIADETRRDLTTITRDGSFESYGIDSFLALRMIKKLEKAIGPVTKTAFFEHTSLNSLADFLAREHRPELVEAFGIDDLAQKTEAPDIGVAEPDLVESTKEFLVGLVSAETKRDAESISPEGSFVSYGIDSFLALRMIKKLEKAIGTVSKTAFFEFESIAVLTDYLIAKHAEALLEFFGQDAKTDQSTGQEYDQEADDSVNGYHVIDAEQLSGNSDEALAILDLGRRFGKENKALARKIIAPLVFLNSRKSAYFNFNISDNIALAFTFVGSEDDLETTAAEFAKYCKENELRCNILSEKVLNNKNGMRFSSNSMGMMQRITDIKSVSLQGSRMRRLRYQISKFEKAGECRFSEYVSGDDPSVDKAIVTMIDRWAETKKMVNPYIWNVRETLLAGGLPEGHRIFLTRLNGDLQNVIIITRMASGDGYLMDLEFYSGDMPLGGLEYGIWHILNTLRDEDCNVFSLGATFGVVTDDKDHGNSDVSQTLSELQAHGAFDGKGNLQFKNKFRPENSILYLSRPFEDSADDVVDVVMMIANPEAPDSGKSHSA